MILPQSLTKSRPDAQALLAWYDRHRRRLPWRAEPGETADPYRVWLSEIMLQQTTVTAVQPYYLRFLERFPTVRDLAEAPVDDVLKLWAGLGYYARARNLHACAKAVMERHGGAFPSTEEALLALPGIGAYTAAAVASIAFGQVATPVDGNVERVVSRLFAVEEPLPGAKPLLRKLAATLTPQHRAGDFAQAMMDLGATVCTPKKALCILCPWNDACMARARGDMERFPFKTPKAEKAWRYGVAFWVERADGAVLLRRRPEKGLLGGMAEIPLTPWGAALDAAEASRHAPLRAQWRVLPGVVTHVFTHFPLELNVWAARVPLDTPTPESCWWSAPNALESEALPSVMRKVVAKARGG